MDINYTQGLSAHQSEGSLHVDVCSDPPGPGGASHNYLLRAPGMVDLHIPFQKGGRHEEGSVVGISNEALIAIVADRLGDFQRGPFRCAENELALVHLDAALELLHDRTSRRLEEGTLGKTQGTVKP